MTKTNLVCRMAKSSLRRYRLYFFCNVFAVALFFCFAALFTDRRFMDPTVVDGMISSNIIAPSVFVAVFTVVFIPWTCRAFQRNSRHEYGILMAVGLSVQETAAGLLAENGLIALLSLLVGLLAGTFLSVFFFFFIHYAIGIAALRWQPDMRPYLFTSALYGATMLLTLVIALLGLARARLGNWISEKYRPEKDRLRLFRMPRPRRSKPGRMRKNFLAAAFLRQHAASTRLLLALATGMTAFCVFFSGLSTLSYGLECRNALRQNPYDLVYADIFGKNRVPDREISALLAKNGVTVRSFKQFEFLRNGAFTILPVSQTDRVLGCRLRVASGRFLTVFQYAPNDGYTHDLFAPEEIPFVCGADRLLLRSAGSDVKILFNDNPAFASQTIVVSDADFSKLASGCGDLWEGTAKLYTFSDWRTSAKAVDAVRERLYQSNRVSRPEQKYYDVSSKHAAFDIGRQSAEFLIFLSAFVAALFFASADLMISFKIRSEEEEERRMIVSLGRIGVTPAELLGVIRRKNASCFLPQTVFGPVLGALALTAAARSCGLGWSGAAVCFAIGAALLALQACLVGRYSAKELASFSP